MCVYTQMCEYMWAWLCIAAWGAQKSISDSLELNLPAFTSWSGFWEPHPGPNNRAASSLNRWATFPALIETSETFCWKLLWGQWSKTDTFEALHVAHGVTLYNFPSLWACARELWHNKREKRTETSAAWWKSETTPSRMASHALYSHTNKPSALDPDFFR